MPRWGMEGRTPLAALRAGAGLSRNAASVTLHVGMSTLQRYEEGQNDVPLGVCELMAELYQVPFDDVRRAVRETKDARAKKSAARN